MLSYAIKCLNLLKYMHFNIHHNFCYILIKKATQNKCSILTVAVKYRGLIKLWHSAKYTWNARFMAKRQTGKNRTFMK